MFHYISISIISTTAFGCCFRACFLYEVRERKKKRIHLIFLYVAHMTQSARKLFCSKIPLLIRMFLQSIGTCDIIHIWRTVEVFFATVVLSRINQFLVMNVSYRCHANASETERKKKKKKTM